MEYSGIYLDLFDRPSFDYGWYGHWFVRLTKYPVYPTCKNLHGGDLMLKYRIRMRINLVFCPGGTFSNYMSKIGDGIISEGAAFYNLSIYFQLNISSKTWSFIDFWRGFVAYKVLYF